VLAHDLSRTFRTVLTHALGVNSLLPIGALSPEGHLGSKSDHVILLFTELKNGLMLLKRQRDVNEKNNPLASHFSIGVAVENRVESCQA
jgi:hypothetical protein